MPAEPPSLCPLSKLGVLEVAGADAQTFLNDQLSQELAALPAARAPLAAWHDARGRVQGLFRVLRAGTGWLLLTHREAVPAIVERLTIYVLRSDVRLRDVTAQWRAAALLGGGEGWVDAYGLDPGNRPGDSVRRADVIWIRVGPSLLHLLAPPEAFGELEAELARGGEAAADLAEIRLGLPELAPVLLGRFTPHMLNLDLLGALSFDKGCYPGQEVIARTQNLGAVKRRMLRFSAETRRLPSVGSRILDGTGAQVAELVRIAPTQNGVDLLAVTQLDAAHSALVSEEDPEVELRREPLAYRI